MNYFRVFHPVFCLVLALFAGVSFSHDGVVLVSPEAKPLEVVQPEGTAGHGRFRLRIVSFNDFHGSFREKNHSIGAAKFVTALEEMRQSFDRDMPTAVCVFCNGDNFSGTALAYYSMFDPETGGEKPDSPMNGFFARCGVLTSSIGNHAFDWDAPSLQTPLQAEAISSDRGGNFFLENHLARSFVRLDDRRFPLYCVSNIVNRRTGRPPGGVPSYDLISIEPYGYRIAVISLTTLETLRSTTAGAASGYRFEKPAVAARRIMEQADKVDAFLFLAHLASYQDKDGTISFGRDSEDMLELLRLKPLAIISGHSHRFVGGSVDGVPVIQAGCHANGLARLDFVIDSRTKRFDPPSREIVNLRPRRDSLKPDDTMVGIVRSAEQSCGFSPVGTAREDMQSDRRRFTDIGVLICKALSTTFNAHTGNEPVLSVQHGGGIRSDFFKGEITEEDCYDMLPFRSGVDLCRLPGRNVLRLLREGMVNPVGYLQSCGLTFYYETNDAPKDAFTHVSFRTENGEQWIDPDKDYWVALDDFIVQGGDGFSKDLFTDRIVIRRGAFSFDVLARYCRDDLNGDIGIDDRDRLKFVVKSLEP